MAGLSRLQAAGVARVSTASGPALVTMSLVQRLAEELHRTGEFDMLRSSMTRVDAQHLFATKEGPGR
jgi:2-methylisocitrate lyase-like PEP mutase family enzyme